MAYIKFKDKSTPVTGSVKIINENLIRIISNDEPDISGFSLFIDKNMKMPMSKTQYEDYTTLYNRGASWYELSNDGSVYVEPEKPIPVVKFIISSGMGTIEGELEQTARNYEDLVIPTVTPAENYKFMNWYPSIPEEGEITKDIRFTAIMEYIPTIEELKAAKIEQLKMEKSIVIEQGFDATLTDGTVEHFSLTADDQLYLTALRTQVLAGADPIPWHVSDDDAACKYYSNADMDIITQTAMTIIVYHITYVKDIIRYVNSITDKEELAEVTYGMAIPEEYQSQPLKDTMTLAMFNA